MKHAASRLAALALLLPLGADAGTWTYGGELAAGYDSNVGNSTHDEFDSTTVYGAASAGRELRYGLYTALQFNASASAEQYDDKEDLSNVGGQLRVRLLHKPGRGFSTPVFGVWASAGARDYGSRIRDSNEYRGGVSAALPVTTAVQLRAEAQWNERRSSGRVFDLGSTSYALNADWAAAPGLTVYGAVRFTDGQYAVTADGEGEIQPKSEHRYLEERADRIEADPAFGADWWAFRIDSEAWIGTAGFNLALSPTIALDMQVLRSESGMGEFTYERWLASVGLLIRW